MERAHDRDILEMIVEEFPMSDSAKSLIARWAIIISLLGSAWAVIKAQVLVPYQIQQLQDQQTKAATDHDLLMKMDAKMDSLSYQLRDLQARLNGNGNRTP